MRLMLPPALNGTTVSATPRTCAARESIRSTRDTRLMRCYAYRRSLGAVVVVIDEKELLYRHVRRVIDLAVVVECERREILNRLV